MNFYTVFSFTCKKVCPLKYYSKGTTYATVVPSSKTCYLSIFLLLFKSSIFLLSYKNYKKVKNTQQSFARPIWFVSCRYDHMKNCRPCNYNEEGPQEFFYLLMQFCPLVQSEARIALLLLCKFSLSPGFISHFKLGNKGKIQLGSLFRANDSLQITHWVCSLHY